MNTLVALGTGAACAYSFVAVVARALPPRRARLMTRLLRGGGRHHRLRAARQSCSSRAKKRLADAVRGLVALQPATARRIVGERDEDIPVEQLAKGDLVSRAPRRAGAHRRRGRPRQLRRRRVDADR
ncbi:MAG: hypothetical protein M5U28_41825 [Sandaracinaceae bacterium]|nr:hypothetical protein [Sandaracinaceae bacterium]